MANIEGTTPSLEILLGNSTEVARTAGQNVRELLRRHEDLVGPGVIERIAQAEAELAGQEYIQRRIEGEANDSHSKRPGLTAYLTPQGCEKAIEICKKAGYAIPATQIEEITLDLVALQFPKGVYGPGGNCMQFYQEADVDWEPLTEAEKPFALEFQDIVRIEGKVSTLWQNRDYQWDGTPKAKESEPLLSNSIEVAQTAEKMAREIASTQALAPSETELLVQKTVSSLLQKFGEKCLKGKPNNERSREIGLTAYLTPEGSKFVIDACKLFGYAIPTAQLKEITPELVALQLPKGVYLIALGGAQFYQEADSDWNRSQRLLTIKGQKGFSLSLNNVVRIEGNANELWQNDNYQWDGTPKQIS